MLKYVDNINFIRREVFNWGGILCKRLEFCLQIQNRVSRKAPFSIFIDVESSGISSVRRNNNLNNNQQGHGTFDL